MKTRVSLKYFATDRLCARQLILIQLGLHYSAILNFMLKIFPDDEIADSINSLDSKQKELFNVVHTWAKDYVKYNRHNVKPLHILHSGSGCAR